MNKQITEQLEVLKTQLTSSLCAIQDTLLTQLAANRQALVEAVEAYTTAMGEARDIADQVAKFGDDIAAIGYTFADTYDEQDDVIGICDDLLGAIDGYENPDDEEEEDSDDGDEEDE